MIRRSRARLIAAALATLVPVAIAFSGCQNPAKVRSFCYIPDKINDTTHLPNPPLPCASTKVAHILAGSRCLDTLISGPTQSQSAYGEDLCCYQATLTDDCDPDQ